MSPKIKAIFIASCRSVFCLIRALAASPAALKLAKVRAVSAG